MVQWAVVRAKLTQRIDAASQHHVISGASVTRITLVEFHDFHVSKYKFHTGEHEC